MPQLSLTEARGVPHALIVALENSVKEPGATHVVVKVLNHDGEIVGSWGGTYRSVMSDYLPSMAQAALEAYLWGEGNSAVTRAVRRVYDSARAHLLRYGRPEHSAR